MKTFWNSVNCYPLFVIYHSSLTFKRLHFNFDEDRFTFSTYHIFVWVNFAAAECKVRIGVTARTAKSILQSDSGHASYNDNTAFNSNSGQATDNDNIAFNADLAIPQIMITQIWAKYTKDNDDFKDGSGRP